MPDQCSYSVTRLTELSCLDTVYAYPINMQIEIRTRDEILTLPETLSNITKLLLAYARLR